MKWLLAMYFIFASVTVVFLYADELKTMYALRKAVGARAPLSIVVVTTRQEGKKDKPAKKLERSIKDAYYKVKKTEEYKKLRVPFALIDTVIVPDIVTEYGIEKTDTKTVSFLFFKRGNLYKQSSIFIEESDDAEKIAGLCLKEIQHSVGHLITRLLEEKEERDYEIEKAHAESRWYGYSPFFDSWYNGGYYPYHYSSWGFGHRHFNHYWW